MAGETSVEQLKALRRPHSVASDAFDNQTALELVIQRIVDSARTRSVEGSTDEQIDHKYFAYLITDIFTKHPIEAVSVSREEKILSPVLEDPGDEEEARRDVPKKKKIQGVDVEAIWKRCKKLQEKLMEAQATIAKLQAANAAMASDYERLLVEETVRKGEANHEEMEEENTEDQVQVWRNKFEAERERADQMEKERDEVRNTISEKRREFEVEKMEFEAMQKELETYRNLWDDPGTRALLQCKSELAVRWEEDEEQEERMLEEILESLESRRPAKKTQKPPKTSKKPSGDTASEPEPREKLRRHITEQDAEISLLKLRLAKAESEREPNPDKAVKDLSGHLDEAVRNLRVVHKEASAADMARNDALAQVRRLERKHQLGGSGKGSAFSAMTPASARRPALGGIKGEEKGANKEGGSGEAEMKRGSLADELKDYKENEDCGSEITIGTALDDRRRASLSERYSVQTMENARLRNQVLKLQGQVGHLEWQLKETGQDPGLPKSRLAEVTNNLNTIAERLRRDGIDPEPFGFSGTLSADMAAHNDLIDERDRCVLAIEGKHPARERLRGVYRERMGFVEGQLRYWEEKHNAAAQRVKEAEARVSVASAKFFVSQNDGARAAWARIQNLEELVSSQLEFHQDVQPLLASTCDLSTELRAVEADVLQKLQVPDEARAKVEVLLEKASQGAGDEAEAREAMRQVLLGLEGAGGIKLEGKWYALRMASGRVRRFVEDARERLQEDALRLGIKVRTPSSIPQHLGRD